MGMHSMRPCLRLWRRTLVSRRAWPLALLPVLTVALAILAGPDRPARADATPLREVDWPSVFANDPTITIIPARSSREQTPGLHISVMAPSGRDLDGYVQVPHDIEY